MLQIKCLMLALSVTCLLNAQGTDTLQTDSVCTLQFASENLGYITDDALGNLYVLDQRNALVKYDPEGVERYRYTNKRLGPVKSLDASNPLKLLLWYGDFRTIAYLDRSLTALGGELNLINVGYPEVRTVAAAADGNIWIFDESTFRLRKIAPEGTLLFESQDLNLIFPSRVAVQYIYDDGSRVFAADSSLGVLVFDTYAQYRQVLNQRGISIFSLRNQYLCHPEQGYLAGLHVEMPSLLRRWHWPLKLLATQGDIRLLPNSIVSIGPDTITRWKWQPTQK